MIFDPVRQLSPLTIEWKVLFQELCNEGTDWDELLTDDHLKEWRSLTLKLQTHKSVYQDVISTTRLAI